MYWAGWFKLGREGWVWVYWALGKWGLADAAPGACGPQSPKRGRSELVCVGGAVKLGRLCIPEPYVGFRQPAEFPLEDAVVVGLSSVSLARDGTGAVSAGPVSALVAKCLRTAWMPQWPSQEVANPGKSR